jgi:DNA polymerase-3 subunit alpha (Gram-positive type)
VAFETFIGDAPLMAHNARFDMRFIETEAVRHGFNVPANPVLDTLALARRVYPDAQSYDMEGLTRSLKLPAGEFHRGLTDAEHVMHLFLRILHDAPLDLDGYMAVGGLSFKTPEPEEK